MAGEWPNWQKIEELVTKGQYMAGNDEFLTFKKKVLKATEDEINAQASHAPVMWDFLIGLAAVKKLYKSFMMQVFNRLTQVPSWVQAFEAQSALQEKLRELPEDLQRALGAQHEVLQKSIAPAVLRSMDKVPMNERPEEVRRHIEKERLVNEIREEVGAKHPEQVAAAFEPVVEASEVPEADERVSDDGGASKALQDGIDAVLAIDDESRMATGGANALNRLRIGCILCDGSESLLQQELGHAHKVFSFLLSYAKREPSAVRSIAEVMNQLMASPSWSAIFESSFPLKESLRELPEEAQTALGLQNAKVLELVAPAAQKRVAGGDVPECVKGVAERMMSIRSPPAHKAAEVALPPAPDKWQEARTPDGHTYYYNLRTRESVWERPAALGGPHVYKVGDEVEVWSNGQRVWGRGRVEKVEGGKVTAEFTLPDKGVAKKELPAGHKDLRPAASGAAAASQPWSEQEKAAYQKWFEALPGAKDSKKGMDVASFLHTSGLKRGALKQLWNVALLGSQHDLGFEEFARCCRLVAHIQALGADAPIVVEAERPLRVKLREECVRLRPPALPRFGG